MFRMALHLHRTRRGPFPSWGPVRGSTAVGGRPVRIGLESLNNLGWKTWGACTTANTKFYTKIDVVDVFFSTCVEYVEAKLQGISSQRKFRNLTSDYTESCC